MLTALKNNVPTEKWSPEELRVLCAWCKVEIRPALKRSTCPPPESHGICVACAVNLGLPLEYLQRQVA